MSRHRLRLFTDPDETRVMLNLAAFSFVAFRTRDFTFQLLSPSVTVSPHKWRPPKKLWWFRRVKSIQ
jgi:hypothetical protein